jgi:arginyl-tRNA synthetase
MKVYRTKLSEVRKLIKEQRIPHKSMKSSFEKAAGQIVRDYKQINDILEKTEQKRRDVIFPIIKEAIMEMFDLDDVTYDKLDIKYDDYGGIVWIVWDEIRRYLNLGGV